MCPTSGELGWQLDDGSIGVYGFQQPNYGFQIENSHIEKILQEITPDVVYQRGRSILQESGAVIRYCKRKNIPYVFGLSSDADTKLLHGITQLSRAKQSLIKKSAIIPYGAWSDWKMRQTLRSADAIITQHLHQFELLPPSLHHKGVILPNLHPEITGTITKPPGATVAWISNYRPLKRGELFLQLAKQCSDLNATFIMILGNARQQYTAHLINQAAAISNLQIFGKCTPQHIDEILRSAWMLVNTSEYEGFSNVFIESWLRETPTLSIGIDPAEALSRHRAGIAAKDFPELVRHVRHLLTHPDECRQLGQYARVYGETNHGLQQNSNRIAEFFLNMPGKLGKAG
ncbi:MAG: Glycosyl transferase group 1 [Chlorobi bacterium OLB7]|nr:MAG: Glycosyl transferase group 1 [Chlorobi bacterium OLB7]